MRNHSAGTIALACVVGVLAGLGQPLALAFSMVCVLATVLAPLLYAWAGLAPATVYLGVSVGAVWGLWGPETAAAALLIFVLPAGVVIALMHRRARFFTRLKAAVGTQAAALLALVFILYAGFGRSLVDVLVETMTGWAETLPEPLAAVLLQQFALTGTLDAESAQAVLSGQLTAAQTLAALREIFTKTGEALRLALPAMLISSSLVTGIFAASLSGLVCARRGDDLDYVPLSGWFVPHGVTGGVAVALVTALILHFTGVSGSESVLTAVLTAGEVIYAAAGAAALSRQFKQAGRGRGFRIALIALAVLFVPRLLAIIGLASSLLGRRGIISGYLRKKSEENDKGDDDL